VVGNDIIDLKEAEQASNWQRPRFLDKLFTLQEQQIIYKSTNQFLMVWQLWSMKEAAYKLYIQLHSSRFYKPKSFECKLDKLKGIVIFQDFMCNVETIVTSNYIISEARLDEHKITSQVVEFEFEDTKTQSKVLRTELLKLIEKRFHTNHELVQVVKNKFGVPRVKLGLKEINVSLTHHGNYGAFAII
jgi:phosphopantetheinyl transferase (holo-ACP synthase)